MEVKLVVLEGKNTGQAVKVAGPKFFIGRADDCQLRPRSDLVSRHHCVILVEEGFVAIRDFGSKNGTFVNDEQLHNERELKAGDQVAVGTLKFEVQLGVEVGGKKKPKVKSVEEAAVRTATGTGEETLAGSEELNLDEWLGVGEHTSNDTQTVDLSEILGEDEPDAPAAAGSKFKVPQGNQDDSEQVKVVGVSAKRAASVTAASTRTAAEDALKNLLRGGGRKK